MEASKSTRRSESEIGWVVDLITEIRSVKSEMGVAPSTLLPLVLVAPSARAARGAKPGAKASSDWPGSGRSKRRMRRPAGALQLVVRGEIVALPLAGVVDLAAQTARLDREIAKERLEIAKVEAKLGNRRLCRPGAGGRDRGT